MRIERGVLMSSGRTSIRNTRRPAGAVGALLCSLSVFVIGALALPAAAVAVSVISVGNGMAAPDGSYLNATNIASTLAFTNVGITATSEIDYVDPVNLGSTVQFGPTYFNLTNTAPITSIQANVTFSSYPFAVFSSVSSQVNLAATFYNASNALLGPSQLTGNAESVNVLSNNANLQQAIDFTQSSLSQSTITAPFGTATSLAFNSDANMILSGGLLSGSVAMNQANSHLELVGSNFQLNTGSGFFAVGAGPITATSGQLEGILASGNSFDISFTQGAAGQINVVPLPPSVWLLLSGLCGLACLRACRRVDFAGSST